MGAMAALSRVKPAPGGALKTGRAAPTGSAATASNPRTQPPSTLPRAPSETLPCGAPAAPEPSRVAGPGRRGTPADTTTSPSVELEGVKHALMAPLGRQKSPCGHGTDGEHCVRHC